MARGAAGSKWSTFIIWAKNTFTLGRLDYHRQYEPILYGSCEWSDNYWCGDWNQGHVWFGNEPVKNDLHPTMKPMELDPRYVDIIVDGWEKYSGRLREKKHTK